MPLWHSRHPRLLVSASSTVWSIKLRVGALSPFPGKSCGTEIGGPKPSSSWAEKAVAVKAMREQRTIAQVRFVVWEQTMKSFVRAQVHSAKSAFKNVALQRSRRREAAEIPGKFNLVSASLPRR